MKKLDSHRKPVLMLINPPARLPAFIREGRCVQSGGAWSAQWPPLSLALCAATASISGAVAVIVDCTAEKIGSEAIFRRIRSVKPDIVVFPAAIIPDDLMFGTLCKNANPHCLTVVFGIHVSASAASLCKRGMDIDLAVSGEPETAVAEIARVVRDIDGCIQSGDKASLTVFSKIHGVSVISRGGVLSSAERKYMDINILPKPRWDLVERSRYIMPGTGRPFLLVATSRGCPEKCVFCAASEYYGNTVRLRKPSLVVDEIQWDMRQYGVKDFLFWGENFTWDTEHAALICEEILARNMKISWVCNGRADRRGLELFRLMRRAGCRMIGFGLESGSDRILSLMGKGIATSDSRKAVSYAKNAGLLVTAHMMVGFPGETADDMRKSIELIDETEPDYVQYYCAVNYPGSKFDARAISEMASGHGRQSQSAAWANGTLTASDIQKIRTAAYLNFYFNPRRIGKMARLGLKEGGLMNAVGFMKWVFNVG